MAKIEFKAKKFTVYNTDDSVAYTAVKVPKITRSHCDMNAMRQHKRFGGFANSNMFEQMVNGHIKNMGLSGIIKLDQVPDFITIKDGFFTIVSFEV